MTDVAHTMGVDLAIASTGDLLATDGDGAVRQRVLHRLLTNPGGYVWAPSYGGGLPQFVGRTLDAAALQAVVRNQMLLETAVARQPLPVVSVAVAADGTVSATITYGDAASGTVQQPSVVLGAS